MFLPVMLMLGLAGFFFGARRVQSLVEVRVLLTLLCYMNFTSLARIVVR